MTDKRIAIHGLGYVGLTAAVHWAKAGWTVIGYDPDEKTIERLRAGTPRAGEFLEYLDTAVSLLLLSPALLQRFDSPSERHEALGVIAKSVHGFIIPTTDFSATVPCPVHLIAVPTEKDGEPHNDIVLALLERIWEEATGDDLAILVESTLTPGTIDRFLDIGGGGQRDLEGSKVAIAVCPRRDWFADRDTHLGVMKRVIGGVTPTCTARAIKLYKNVSHDIEPTDYQTAEITKALENALLHAAIMLPTELAMNMRDRNVAEALRLATTHPRLMPLFLGGGSGGRCIPLGPKYLLAHKGPHEMLRQALTVDRHIRMACADAVAQRGCKTALVLGIAYRPDFKDAGNSPGLAIAQHLRRTHGIEVCVADPMWSEEDLANLTGFSVDQPENQYDALVLVTPHSAFLKNVERRGARFILDCQGAWLEADGFAKMYFVNDPPEYKQLGQAGWLR